jgi:hypothetical protein
MRDVSSGVCEGMDRFINQIICGDCLEITAQLNFFTAGKNARVCEPEV